MSYVSVMGVSNLHWAEEATCTHLCCACYRWKEQIKGRWPAQSGLAEEEDGCVLLAPTEEWSDPETSEVGIPDYATSCGDRWGYQATDWRRQAQSGLTGRK